MSLSADLQQASQHCRLLADSTRLRLLLLLDREELSVAELAAITQLAQPRVSTHLAKLKEARLVNDRRSGVNAFYRLTRRIEDQNLSGLWEVLRTGTDDPLVRQDLARIPRVLAARTADGSWADTVAGDMERHYSPGRTWEATARALSLLLVLGDVLDVASGDGVLAELLAPRARRITCLDISQRVVAAGQQRVAHLSNVEFAHGDMHDLPVAEHSQDLVLLLHALTFTTQPRRVFREAARVLRPGGRLLAVTLQQHKHEKAVAPFDHRNLGFEEQELVGFCRGAGLAPLHCGLAGIEKRPPHFAVLNLLAERPAESGTAGQNP